MGGRESERVQRVKKEVRLGDKRATQSDIERGKKAAEQRKQTKQFQNREREKPHDSPKARKGHNQQFKEQPRETVTSSPPPLLSLHPMVLVAKPTPHYGSLGFL